MQRPPVVRRAYESSASSKTRLRRRCAGAAQSALQPPKNLLGAQQRTHSAILAISSLPQLLPLQGFHLRQRCKSLMIEEGKASGKAARDEAGNRLGYPSARRNPQISDFEARCPGGASGTNCGLDWCQHEHMNMLQAQQ